MSLMVVVNSVEKGCPVILNLEHVREIAPWKDGGCAIFLSDSTRILVKDPFSQFEQFAMQPVKAEDIAARFPTKKGKKEDHTPLEIPKL